MTEQEFHCVIVLLQMLVKLWNHQSHQFPQILQILIDVVVSWRTNENCSLHETNKAPESLRFVLQLAKDGRQEITHALSVASGKGKVRLIRGKFWQNSRDNSFCD